MYKLFQVAFVISALTVSTLAETSFCKCRTDNKPDNDMTESCCNNGMDGMDLYYSLEHHRVRRIPLKRPCQKFTYPLV
ncbi:hypothetical protein PILCRDRAFT_624990 [Piloderma croceum F 1598]|uniref:Hydrophobin n=1 Tax=Piloderma croceum (strain F 1598) TaxID=765440 RepID=A0A0C3EXG5_PILCF|nr:hypothetical protein PILCRDRAFT_624990 [Piloderma croceum F 1598]